MLGRKKRKRIEIQRVADRKHRRPEPPVEKKLLTRRTFAFKGLAVASFAALSGRLWQLQFRDRAQLQAEEQVFAQRPFPLPAARGMIFDRRRQLIADNIKSWAVAIVPASLPDDKTQRAAIYDTLARALEMPDVVAIVPKDLPTAGADEARRVREEIYARLATTLGLAAEDIRGLVETELREKVETKRGFKPWLLVGKNLTADGKDLPPDKVAAIRAAEAEWKSLGVQVINPIRYQVDIDGIYDAYVPLTIKQGVKKEVALGIEANRLYLPGVQISDQFLGRRYHIGEELGHILGYTGPISAEEYEAAVVRDERGRPLVDGNGRVRRLYQANDHVGKAGLEAALEETLRGKRGRYVAQVNANGEIVGEYPQARQEPVDGHNVVLTIDLNYQRDVIGILQRGIDYAAEYIKQKNEGERRVKRLRPLPPPPGTGAAVAINPRTGEILALVSLPGYDPRHFVNGITQQQFDAYAEVGVPYENKKLPLQNRCVQSHFPPGSTLKTFIALAGLQEGVINKDTKYKCLGRIEVPHDWDEYERNHYWCWTRDASHQDQDVRMAIATSCDVFFYNLGAPAQKTEAGLDLHYYQPNGAEMIPFNGLGIARINKYLHLFGFGEKTGVELANEVEGIVPGPEWKERNFTGNDRFWSVGDTIVTSIGQGYDLVTPLQLCNATAAIGNGGTLWRPTLVQEVRDNQDRVIRQLQPTPLRKLPLDRKNLDLVREGMRMSITYEHGLVHQSPTNPTGFPLPPGMDAGVKTGTAEYGTEVDEDGLQIRAHAWCTAFAPFNDPEICVVAFVEGGSASAAVAAPVASQMINAYFARKNAG